MSRSRSGEGTIYLPGLNGIRAIAALIVMVFHTDQWSGYFGLTPYGFWDTRMQTYAVVLFFVLSGFLITYLLLKEKEKSGKISLKKFYIRRILRIWPVYYLVLIVGILLLITMSDQIQTGLPAEQIVPTITLFGLLIPNVAMFLGYSPDLIGILWSVGVEEQFYAFWPFLVRKSKVLIRTLIVFVGIYLIVKAAAGLGYLAFIHPRFSELMFFLPFDCMAIGAIAADLFYNKRKILQIIYHPASQIAAWIFLFVSVFWYPVQVPYLDGFQKEVHAFVYAVIILNVSTNSRTLVSLENRVFDFLGKISYGIYAYHFIVLFLVSQVLKHWLPSLPSGLGHGLMFIAEAAATIIVAYISYNFYESRFLRWKHKYLVVKSSNTKQVPTEEIGTKAPSMVCES